MKFHILIRWFILSLSLTPVLVPVTVYGEDAPLHRDCKSPYTMVFSGRVNANGHPYGDQDIQLSVKTENDQVFQATARTEMDGRYTVSMKIDDYMNSVADWQLHAVSHHPDEVLAEGRNILGQNAQIETAKDLVVPDYPEAKTILAMLQEN